MLARRFLGCVFLLALLAVAGGFAVYQFGGRALVRMSTPHGHFEPQPPGSGPDYAQTANWLDSAASWEPDGAPIDKRVGPAPAATFYIHPTTYLETDRWNAPLLPDGETEARTQLFVRHQASAFTGESQVWAPRYRQAAFGAFLLRTADAKKALDLAYGDVARAFETFLAANGGRPIILAGHSQGALHLLRLLQDKKDILKGRLIAAYVVGWPVGITADLPATGLAPCRLANSTGCVLSWQTFKAPANPALVLNSWVGTEGLAGRPRTRADILCVDPVSGSINGRSAASANPGTLAPNAAFTTATLERGQVGAACDQGFLTADGNIPSLGNFALPGNNLHPYDYALYWGALRADVARRTNAFEAAK